MKKKLAVIVCVRYRDGEQLRARFLEKHGDEYDAKVVTHPEKLRGYLADLYIMTPLTLNPSVEGHQAWYALRNRVRERSSKNDAPIHSSRKYL